MNLARLLLKPVAFAAGAHASRQAAAFIRAHQRTEEIQDNLLHKLLAAHADTDFGRDHGFARIKNYDDFTSAVPVSDYEGIRPYIDRVLGGRASALLPKGQAPLMFSMTSGTTGRPKHIPVPPRFLAQMRQGWNIFGLMVLNDHSEAWLRNIVQISSPMNEHTSPSGVPCGSISGLLAATQKRIVRRMYAASPRVGEITDPAAKYYTILRSAVEKDVAIITTANPSSTIKLIETGQEHADRLIDDIARGTLNPPGEIDPRTAAKFRFRPRKKLADKLRSQLADDGRLLPRHFWDVTFLTNWTGGTLKLYMPRLRELFPGVPIRDIGLLASEGRFSIPMRDDTPAGVAEITNNFLEFIPAEQRGRPDPDVLRAHEVEVGGEYFLVASNWAGLWRYDIDDRVRVTDRLGMSPVFEFVCRGSQTANITGEKITENQVVEAMDRAASAVGARCRRFVVRGRFANPPHYELHIEAEDNTAHKLAEAFEAALAELNMEYRSKRHSQRLGPVRPVVLTPGTLARAEQENIRARHGRSEQYKHKYLETKIATDTDD